MTFHNIFLIFVRNKLFQAQKCKIYRDKMKEKIILSNKFTKGQTFKIYTIQGEPQRN